MKIVLFHINPINIKQLVIGFFTQSNYCHAAIMFNKNDRLEKDKLPVNYLKRPYDASESRGNVDFNKTIESFGSQKITIYEIPDREDYPAKYALRMRGVKYDWKGIAGWAPLPFFSRANDREKVYCFELVLQVISRFEKINGLSTEKLGSDVFDKLYQKRIDSDDILILLQRAGLTPVYTGKAKDYTVY